MVLFVSESMRENMFFEMQCEERDTQKERQKKDVLVEIISDCPQRYEHRSGYVIQDSHINIVS